MPKKILPEDITFETFVLNRTVGLPTAPDCDWGFDGNYITKHSGRIRQFIYSYVGASRRKKMEIMYKNSDGIIHREFGPAIINEAYDCEFWLFDGVLHRDNGPAYRHAQTYKWYRHGILHRTDGPAVTSKGEPPEYWIDGQKYSPKEYKKEIKRRQRKGHYAK